jgi:hypothetical protein
MCLYGNYNEGFLIEGKQITGSGIVEKTADGYLKHWQLEGGYEFDGGWVWRQINIEVTNLTADAYHTIPNLIPAGTLLFCGIEKVTENIATTGTVTQINIGITDDEDCICWGLGLTTSAGAGISSIPTGTQMPILCKTATDVIISAIGGGSFTGGPGNGAIRIGLLCLQARIFTS